MITQLKKPFLFLPSALLWTLVPAAAEEGLGLAATPDPGSPEAYSLHLEVALPDLALGQEAATETSYLGEETGAGVSILEPRIRPSAPDQAEAWETWHMLQQAESQAAPKKRRFGRWLKKHWYVPVLVAGALAFALEDDDSDDEEDDD